MVIAATRGAIIDKDRPLGWRQAGRLEGNREETEGG